MAVSSRINFFTFLIIVFLGYSSYAARYGTPVLGHYPGVALIQGGGLAGTGVLISEDLVLTVNHVVGRGTSETLKVTFDYVPGYQNKSYRVEDFRIYSQDIHHEVALLKLSESVLIRPYALYAAPVARKAILYGVGYGMTLNPDLRPFTMTRAEMIFRGYFPMGELLPGSENQLGCPGDSGGPVFIKMEGEESQVVGLAGHIIGNFKTTDTNAEACRNAKVVRFLPIKDYMNWISVAAQDMGASLF